MKKKLLILSAVIAVSTSLVYADDYTSQDGKANYTYSNNDITIDQTGTTSSAPKTTVDINDGSYSIKVVYDESSNIYNRKRTIKTTLISLNEGAGNYNPKSDNIVLIDTKNDVGAKINGIDSELITFTVEGDFSVATTNPLYATYEECCQQANSVEKKNCLLQCNSCKIERI